MSRVSAGSDHWSLLVRASNAFKKVESRASIQAHSFCSRFTQAASCFLHSSSLAILSCSLPSTVFIILTSHVSCFSIIFFICMSMNSCIFTFQKVPFLFFLDPLLSIDARSSPSDDDASKSSDEAERLRLVVGRPLFGK
uniref:Uncharacterized protein n=1 Tax=Opuntia streptacantha TaxID=393608 RepID=A0A7C9CLF6_OPUST